MIDNQTQTEVEAERVIGVDTSNEGSVVEVILEDKKQHQAPQHEPDTI